MVGSCRRIGPLVSIGPARSTRCAWSMNEGGSWSAVATVTMRPVCARCVRLTRLGVMLVALERPDGLLIERLLDAGLSVTAVHPNQVVAMRPCYTVSGGKSDGCAASSWRSLPGPTTIDSGL